MSSDNKKNNSNPSRICFVIMPFSKSKSCSKSEWTKIYKDVITPAVEKAHYKCHRSSATRGNLIKGIIEDLDSSWVVLADLTDRNPNVFYELGVRHALKNRTILIAQDRNDIPFDLQSYANHIYDWKTVEERELFTKQIQILLKDVDQDPFRADNPVSDFLKSPTTFTDLTSVNARINEIESRLDSFESGMQFIINHSLSGNNVKSDLDKLFSLTPFDNTEILESWYNAGKEIVSSKETEPLRKIVNKSTRYIDNNFASIISQLKSTVSGDQIEMNQINNEATKFIEEFTPNIINIELFALGLSSGNWEPCARGILDIAGAMISSGEGLSGIRFAYGLPAYFAWRLIILCGAYSMLNESYDYVNFLINGPIPVIRSGGQTTYQPLFNHRDLFYPEALLGYADLGMEQLSRTHKQSPHIQNIFDSEENFIEALTEFLILVALRDAENKDRLLYPGFKLLRNCKKTCEKFVSRLATSDKLEAISKTLNTQLDLLENVWSERAEKVNNTELGTNHWREGFNSIPTTLKIIS